MELKDIVVGTKLELTIFNEYGDQLDENLISQFEGMTAHNSFCAAVPLRGGLIVPVHIGAKANVFFSVDEDLFLMKVVVVSRSVKDGFPLLELMKTGEINKIQRRQWFRLDTFLDIEFREWIVNENDEVVPMAYERTITHDVSGGGISILTKEKKAMHSLLECQLSLPDKSLWFIAEVVRVKKNDPESAFHYELGLRFAKVEKSEQERLIRFIFSQQRKLLRKGMI